MVFNLKRFVKKHSIKDDTMTESGLQKVYDYSINPECSAFFSDRTFVNFDNGSMGGSHWAAFYVKNSKLFSFDSFRGQLDNFLLSQLPKPIIYHDY